MVRRRPLSVNLLPQWSSRITSRHAEVPKGQPCWLRRSWHWVYPVLETSANFAYGRDNYAESTENRKDSWVECHVCERNVDALSICAYASWTRPLSGTRLHLLRALYSKLRSFGCLILACIDDESVFRFFDDFCQSECKEVREFGKKPSLESRDCNVIVLSWWWLNSAPPFVLTRYSAKKKW